MSSSSKSSQATSQTDARRVLGERAISAEGNAAVNVWNQSVDAGVVADALAFGGKALAVNSDTFSDALGFADAQASRVNTLVGNTFSDALGFLESAATRFGSMTDKVLDNQAATADLVKDAYADAKGRGALTDKMILAAIIAMAAVAYMAVKK